MFLTKKISNKEIKLIGISICILIVVCLNFYMLNKVIGNSNTPTNFEKIIKF